MMTHVPQPTILLASLLMLIFQSTALAVDEEVVVVKAGRVITGTGEEIDRGQVVIVDGDVAAVGRRVEYPRTATVVDAQDETVMPGFVHPRTRYGLPGYRRSGLNAHLSVMDEVYLEQIDFDRMLEGGFTAATYIPSGTGLPGRAAVFRTAGPEADRLVREHAYLRIGMTNPGRDKRVMRNALRRAESEIEKVEQARREWEQEMAERQQEAKEEEESENEDSNGENEDSGPDEEEPKVFDPPEIDEQVQPLVDLLRGEPGVLAMIEISSASDFIHLMDVLAQFDDFARNFHVSSGTRDLHHAIDEIAEQDAIVLTAPTLRVLPNTVIRYNVMGELFSAGVEVAAVATGDSRSALANFRVQLADMVRSGLDREDAIRALTLNPARVAGVDDQLGTIENGKSGDLVFLDGDPFDGHSSVHRVMIRGEVVWEAGNR